MMELELSINDRVAVFNWLQNAMVFCQGTGSIWEYAKETYGVEYYYDRIRGEENAVFEMHNRLQILMETANATDTDH